MNVRIYVEPGSPSCAGAKRLLDEKGIRYDEIDVREPGRRAEMERLTSGRTELPQIFFGDQHVGGYEDLLELERMQGIRTLLPRENRWAPEP